MQNCRLTMISFTLFDKTEIYDLLGTIDMRYKDQVRERIKRSTKN